MAKERKYENFKDFLKKKKIEISVQRYLIDALKYMAFGLFGTLLIGSIINQIGVLTGMPASKFFRIRQRQFSLAD